MAPRTRTGTTRSTGSSSPRSSNEAAPKKAATSAKKSATKAARKSTARTATSATTTSTAAKQIAKKAAAPAKRAAKKAASPAKRAAASASAPKDRATSTSRGRTADAIAILKADHERVEKLFRRFEKLGQNAHATREASVAKMIEELSVHAVIEEQVVYPDARRRFDGDDAGLVLEALEEHHIVKWTLSELEGMRSDDERFTAKVTVLIEMVRHHVEEEEQEFFPKLREAATPSELRDLGAELAAARRAAPSRPHPRSPDTPPGNLVATALTAPLDATARVADGIANRVRDIVS